MKKAVTEQDKMSIRWMGMQRILESREAIKWLMPFLCGPKIALGLGLSQHLLTKP